MIEFAPLPVRPVYGHSAGKGDTGLGDKPKGQGHSSLGRFCSWGENGNVAKRTNCKRTQFSVSMLICAFLIHLVYNCL